MNSDAMQRFDVPDRTEIPEEYLERIDAERERSGFVPNVFAAYAYAPRQAMAFFEYYDALVDGHLSREELEMVIVAVSGANDCLYCVVAHGALLRIYAEAPQLAEQLATNHRTADISDAHRAMCDVAVKLTEDPAAVEEADLQHLDEHGFSRQEIWDIGSVTALFNLSNRMAHFADMRPNEEFYSMGRGQSEQE